MLQLDWNTKPIFICLLKLRPHNAAYLNQHLQANKFLLLSIYWQNVAFFLSTWNPCLLLGIVDFLYARCFLWKTAIFYEFNESVGHASDTKQALQMNISKQQKQT